MCFLLMRTTNYPALVKIVEMYARDVLAEISRIAVSVAIDCTIYNESSFFNELSWDHGKSHCMCVYS